MDFISKYKLYFITSIVAIVLNILVLFSFWYIQKNNEIRDKNSKNEKTMDIRAYLIDELDLDSTQINKLDVILEEYIAKVNEKRRIIKELHVELNNKIFSDTDSNILEKEFVSLGIKKGELDKLSFEYLRKINQICNRHQQEKFKEIFNEIGKEILNSRAKN